MSKFKRHISAGKDVKIKNETGEEDVFHISPLPYEVLGDFFGLMKAFGKVDFKEIESIEDEGVKASRMLDLFDKDTVSLMSNLVFISLETSYPEEPKDQLKCFVTGNLMKLLPEVIEVNTRNLS